MYTTPRKGIFWGTVLSFLTIAFLTSGTAMAAPPHKTITTTTTQTVKHGRVVETTTTTTEIRGGVHGHARGYEGHRGKSKHAKKARKGHRHDDHYAPVYHAPRETRVVRPVYRETRPVPVRTVHSGPKVVFPSQVVVNLPRIHR